MSHFKAAGYALMVVPEKQARFEGALEEIASIEGEEQVEVIRKRLWRAIMPNVQSGCFPPSAKVKEPGPGVPDLAFEMSFSGAVLSASIDTALDLVILHDIIVC